jgi:hypothetical protein
MESRVEAGMPASGKGREVRICAIHGLILLVEPEQENDPEHCKAK